MPAVEHHPDISHDTKAMQEHLNCVDLLEHNGQSKCKCEELEDEKAEVDAACDQYGDKGFVVFGRVGPCPVVMLN